MTRFTFLVVYCYTTHYSSSYTRRACFLCAFAQIAKIFFQPRHVSVRLSVCITAASTVRIFVKLDICDFAKICLQTPHLVKIWQKYRALCTNINYVYIVDSSAKYFAARRQCQGSPVLRFHGNTHRFCIVDNYMYVNSTNGNACDFLFWTPGHMMIRKGIWNKWCIFYWQAFCG